MENKEKKYFVSDIDKAVNQRLSPVFKSSAEQLVQFLIYNNRKYVANKLSMLMQGVNPDNHIALSPDAEADLIKQEKQAFLQAIVETSEDVFKLPVLPRKSGESNADYKLKLKEYYQNYSEQGYSDNGFLQDVKLMHQYKKLVSKVFNDLGYESPDYNLFSNSRVDDNGYKRIDLNDSSELLDEIVDYAASSQNGYDLSAKPAKYVYPFSYVNNKTQTQTKDKNYKLSELKPSSYNKWNNKLNLRKLKNGLFYTMVIVASIIGLGEGFAPAKFYLLFVAQKMAMAGMVAGPVPLVFAGVAFLSAFCVNAILFQGDSYKALINLLPMFKNRFVRDAKGKPYKSPRLMITLNILAVVLAVFSAFTIASISFFFSGFGVGLALLVSAMTLIGFAGVLTIAVMGLSNGILDGSMFSDIGKFLSESLLKPLQQLYANKFNIFSLAGAKSLAVFIVNVIALAAMVIFGVAVIAATAGMFFSALAGIPLLAGTLGLVGIGIIVGVAEIALGAFFITNVVKFVNAVRTIILDSPSMVATAFKSIFMVIPKVDNIAKDHPARNTRVNIGKVLGATLLSFAFINAGGYAFGYLGTPITHKFVISALGFGGLLTTVVPFLAMALLVVAPFIAAASYTMSSVGGNASAALSVTKASDGLHCYNDYSLKDLDAKHGYVKPDAPIRPGSAREGDAAVSDLSSDSRSVASLTNPLLNLAPNVMSPISSNGADYTASEFGEDLRN